MVTYLSEEKIMGDIKSITDQLKDDFKYVSRTHMETILPIDSFPAERLEKTYTVYKDKILGHQLARVNIKANPLKLAVSIEDKSVEEYFQSFAEKFEAKFGKDSALIIDSTKQAYTRTGRDA